MVGKEEQENVAAKIDDEVLSPESRSSVGQTCKATKPEREKIVLRGSGISKLDLVVSVYSLCSLRKNPLAGGSSWALSPPANR